MPPTYPTLVTWHGISKTRCPLAVRGPELLPWDVYGDGTIDVVDLVTVARAFGTTGQGVFADVNGDGRVNIVDLVTVAEHFGESATLAAPRMPTAYHLPHLDLWVREARAAGDPDTGDLSYRRGTAALERLLRRLALKRTALLPNYPNPFNPEMWIPFDLHEGADVRFTVYDTAGRVVRVLDLGRLAPGAYRTRARAAHWDGRNRDGDVVSSDSYFVELDAGVGPRVRRVVVLK